MAKKDKEPIVIDPEVDENENEETTEETTEELRVNSEIKKVQIHATEDIECIIAQKPYNIKKGAEVKVPLDVASVLVYSQKAYRM